jgi:hypothetical protein
MLLLRLCALDRAQHYSAVAHPGDAIHTGSELKPKCREKAR